jgi:flagellar biosynthetic protein FliQ
VSHQLVIELARNAVLTAVMLAGPLLLVALGVGLLVSILQAVTQLQEQTLSFVPKLLAVAAVMLLALPWMMQVIVKYTVALFRGIPSLTL